MTTFIVEDPRDTVQHAPGFEFLAEAQQDALGDAYGDAFVYAAEMANVNEDLDLAVLVTSDASDVYEHLAQNDGWVDDGEDSEARDAVHAAALDLHDRIAVDVDPDENGGAGAWSVRTGTFAATSA